MAIFCQNVTQSIDWLFRNRRLKWHTCLKVLAAFYQVVDPVIYAYDQTYAETSQTCIWILYHPAVYFQHEYNGSE